VSDWKELLEDSLTEPDEVASFFGLDPAEVKNVTGQYPVLINGYYRRLCTTAGGPIIGQVVPDPVEISTVNESVPEDPVGEELYSPVSNLTHRYNDRVLFLISNLCPVYCRFCTRKRKVGKTLTVTPETLREGFSYIARHTEIRDVLLSGGDPLMLEDDHLASVLERLRRIDHIEILRIGTRVPAALPNRITPKLVSVLSNNQPLYIHTHFNHPAEITEESKMACRQLAEAGIGLSNQTVLLSGINDESDILEKLFRALLIIGVRPYYLFQVDLVRGTRHFRTPLSRGIEIIEELRLRTSPMSLPTFVVDLPGAAGKAFPAMCSVLNAGRHDQIVLTPDGNKVPYPDP
jgi:lysine 2,3-aminomutase